MANKADKLILGNIITMDDNNMHAEAVACKDGKILYVGTKDGAKEYCDDNTKTIDYGKNTVYPGFIDSHAHGAFCGWRELGQAHLMDGHSYDDYVAIFKKYIEDNPGREYYVGSGWAILGEPPTHELLDRVSTTIPLIANSGDGHSMLLNKKAMEICQVTKEMVKQFAPGEIKVDANGEPNGMFSEEPTLWLLTHLPITMEEMKSFILYWQDYAFSHGYTGAAEAASKLISELQTTAYIELDNENKLKLRTFSFASINDNTDTPEEDVENVMKEKAKEKKDGRFKTTSLKVFLDGVLEARTSWEYDEYNDEKGYHGVSRFRDHDKMVRLIKAASKYNLSVHAHSVGDGATHFMMQCIEDAQKEIGNNDQRNALAHLQHVLKEDFEKFGKTKTVAVTPPLWLPMPKDMLGAEIKSVGEKKVEEDYPIGSFFKAGAPTVFHTDYPAGFIMHVPGMISCAIDRCVLDQKENTFRGPEEVVTPKQALLALTKNVAWMFREENNLGSLEVGKCADMSIFNFNFLDDKITKDNIGSIHPVATIVAGEVVYEDKDA